MLSFNGVSQDHCVVTGVTITNYTSQVCCSARGQEFFWLLGTQYAYKSHRDFLKLERSQYSSRHQPCKEGSLGSCVVHVFHVVCNNLSKIRQTKHVGHLGLTSKHQKAPCSLQSSDKKMYNNPYQISTLLKTEKAPVVFARL